MISVAAAPWFVIWLYVLTAGLGSNQMSKPVSPRKSAEVTSCTDASDGARLAEAHR